MRDMSRHARGREPADGVALSREGCSACARTPRIARSKHKIYSFSAEARNQFRTRRAWDSTTQNRFARAGRMIRPPLGRFARAGRLIRSPRVDLRAQPCDGWEGGARGVGLAPPRPSKVHLLAQTEWFELPLSSCSRRAKVRFVRAGRVIRPPRGDLFSQGE